MAVRYTSLSSAGRAGKAKPPKTAPKPSEQNTTPQTKPEPEKILVSNNDIVDDQTIIYIINRSGVAGAVLQTAS